MRLARKIYPRFIGVPKPRAPAFDRGAVGLAAASLRADVTLTDLPQAASSATNWDGFLLG